MRTEDDRSPLLQLCLSRDFVLTFHLRKGYLHIPRTHFGQAVTNGTLECDVRNQYGLPFEWASCPTGGSWQGWHYWCRDGEVYIELRDDVVVNVDTNCSWGRL